MNELTDSEKQWIIEALPLVPMTGNTAQVMRILQTKATIIKKLSAVEQHDNGKVKEEEKLPVASE